MHGRPARLALICAVFLAPPVRLLAQEPQDSTNDLRYRWSVKVDTSLAGQAAFPTSVAEMLTTWRPLDVGPKDDDAARQGRELHVYRLAGWIRRAKQNDDGDVHLSLTATPNGSEDSCVVAEIPAERYGTVFRRARADLLPILEGTRIKKSGRLAPPVVVLVTGAAFYDGKHLERPKGHGKHKQGAEARSHGDCNASPTALWEIHPVYRVEQP
jgi:hypothetical protein